MSEESVNPYSTPTADDMMESNAQTSLYDMEWKALEKLYYRSCNVSGLVALMCLAVAIFVIALFNTEDFTDGSALFMASVVLFYSICIFGLYNRTSWGRKVGIFVCILSLINIPLGTIIGLMGLFAFFKAPELFGEGRITHKYVKSVFDERKKIRKAEKKAGKKMKK